MKCEKCNGKKLQVVSELVEKDEDSVGFLGVIILLGIILLIVGVYFIIEAFQVKANLFEYFTDIPQAIKGFKCLGFSFLCFFAFFLINRLMPYRYETKTKVVCMDCGHTWELKKEVQAENEQKQNKDNNN